MFCFFVRKQSYFRKKSNVIYTVIKKKEHCNSMHHVPLFNRYLNCSRQSFLRLALTTGLILSNYIGQKPSMKRNFPSYYIYEVGSNLRSKFTNLLYSFTNASSTVPTGPFRCFAIIISIISFFSVSLS